MKNPCLTCRVHLSGVSKAHEPKCRNCSDRVAYVAALGGMTHSVPLDLTTLGGDTGPGDIDELRITAKEEEVEAMNTDNTPGGIIRRLCEENGITPDDLKSPVDKSKRPGVVNVRKAAVRELSGRNLPHRQIADLLGLHHTTNGQLQKELGIWKPSRTRPKKKTTGKRLPEIPVEGKMDILGILFAGHEKTLEQVRKVAKEEMRTPENQVVYIVKTCIEDAIREHLEEMQGEWA